MDSNRSYYEYPATYGAIQALPARNFGSLTPAKAKKTWGDILKIPGKSKKEQATSPRSTIYAAGLNLSPTSSVNGYGTSPYGVKPGATPPSYSHQNGQISNMAEYRQKYGPYNATYGRASINPVVQYRPKEQMNGNVGSSMTYGDWFGSVVSRKPHMRPAIPQLKSPNNPHQAWDNYTNVQSPPQHVIQVPAAVPVPIQLLNNVCLCPEQLFSTKSKTKKKCKKCGCKIATIRNATTTAGGGKFRPAIPANLYQAPIPQWRWSSPVAPPNYPQQQQGYPPMLSSFHALPEEATPPHTPETVKSVKSFRSGISSDSNATITRRRIRQVNAIPPPPTTPLPSVPSKKAGDESKNSIMKETKTAYQLLEEEKTLPRSSDPDDLSDNAVNDSWEILNDSLNHSSAENSRRKSSLEISSANLKTKIPSANKESPRSHNNRNDTRDRIRSLSYSNISSANTDKHYGTVRSYIPFGKMSNEEAHTTRRRSESSSSLSNRTDIVKLGSGTKSGKQFSSHQTQKENIPNQKPRATDRKSSSQISIPKRDDKKVVSIAGQRILFDRGSESPKSKSPQVKSQPSIYDDRSSSRLNVHAMNGNINNWENLSVEEDSLFNERTLSETPAMEVISERLEKQVNQMNSNTVPSVNHMNSNTVPSVNNDTKWSSYLSTEDNTIQEEDEDNDDVSSELTRINDCNTRLNGSSVINIDGHASRVPDLSSSETSPLSRPDFQATLSELLQVKSILKRPNSIDTSSETDSDFYLPSYAEFKQIQRKKKSVQFRPSNEVNLLEDAGESKGRKVSSIRYVKRSKDKSKTQLFISHDDSKQRFTAEKDNFSSSATSNGTSESDLMFTEVNGKDLLTEEKMDTDSSSLCQRLEMSQITDMSVHNGKQQGISPIISSNKHLLEQAPIKPVRKVGLSARGLTIPSRPTVPPPPPPCIVNKIPAHSGPEKSHTNRTGPAILDDPVTISPDSSPCSTPPPLPSSSPPPLPTSSPPPLDDDILPTFTSFYDLNKDQDVISIESIKPKPAITPLYELKEQLPGPSEVQMFQSREESQTATIKTRKKSPKQSLPTAIPEVQSIYKEGIRKLSSGVHTRRHYNSPGQRLSFLGTMAEDGESEDRISEHIYEELRSIASSPSGSSISSPTGEKSIFDGASKYEILEFLRDARKRVRIEDDDELPPNLSIRSEMDALAIEEEETADDPLLTSIYRDGRSSNRSSNSDSSETSALVRTDKERLQSGEIERTDSGVGSETSKPTIRIRKGHHNTPTSQGSKVGLRDGRLPPCDDCDSPVEAKETTSGLMYAPLVCRRCYRRRQERKEILLEIVETEVKYGRDLKVMKEQFYSPMELAILLNKEQLGQIFLNIEELTYHNRQFALQLKHAYETALDQGDEDLLSVNVAKLFIRASPMLHSFQNYCVRQSEASELLQNLEKERELLRIFLKVSQMENTLLRRMNLHSFLMVPVQRITKYPLLLSRLYKTTPPSHSSREDCRKAREKIEVYLQHINDETRGTSSTKLWRRISMSVGGSSNVPPKRPPQPPDCDTSAKIRNIALEILDWNDEEATVIREGRLLCLPPDSGNWTRRGRSLKMTSVQVVLITLGRPLMTLEEAVPEDGLITPRNLGIKEAALLAFKDHRLSKSAMLREPWMLSNVVLSWDSEGETETFELTDIASKETYIFKDRDSASTEEWFRSAQFHGLAVGTWRGRRTAMANIMINGARRS